MNREFLDGICEKAILGLVLGILIFGPLAFGAVDTLPFLFIAIINNLHRKEPVQIISFALVFLAMAISFYGFYQFLTNSQKVWNVINGYAHRGSGTYICPNHLAGFLEMILPV